MEEQEGRAGIGSRVRAWLRNEQLLREIGEIEAEFEALLADPGTLNTPEHRTETLRLYGRLSVLAQTAQRTGKGIAAGALTGAAAGVPLPLVGPVSGSVLGGVVGHVYTRRLRREMLSRIAAVRERLETAVASAPQGSDQP